MELKQINQNFTISDQVKLEDIKTLADNGVKTLICNRPEGEEPNQLTNQQIISEANKVNIEFIHIPSPGRDIPEDALQQFIETINHSTGKVHAYCRTGTRSSIFWDLMQQQ